MSQKNITIISCDEVGCGAYIQFDADDVWEAHTLLEHLDHARWSKRSTHYFCPRHTS